MHKNIQTVAGCITRITCNFTTPDNQAPEITAYCLVEKEYRAATKEAGGVLYGFGGQELTFDKPTALIGARS